MLSYFACSNLFGSWELEMVQGGILIGFVMTFWWLMHANELCYSCNKAFKGLIFRRKYVCSHTTLLKNVQAGLVSKGACS